MRCTLLGAGAFGTALAVHLAKLGHQVTLWDRDPARCEHMNRLRHNPRYLGSVELPETLRAESDVREAVRGTELLVTVVPSHVLREIVRQVADLVTPEALVCCATKGIEDGTLDTMATLLSEELPLHEVHVFSGPSFAAELAAGLPTTVVVAGPSPGARQVADAFHGGRLRVYDTPDVVGVCVGGSLKNVIAIGCGISDGLGLGQNTRAAIITRGLAEMTRVSTALGGDPRTMMGLAGLGDLVLTCTGDLSRNRRLGKALGEGQALDAALASLGGVAEGLTTARSAAALGRKLGVELPITDQVHQVLYESKPARQALSDLLGRERKAE